jgi:mono/diheme cytochrome c family protein
MNRVLLGLGLAAAAAILLVAVGCASLATPETPGSGSPAPSSGGTVKASQQVKDGAQLYVSLTCIRCHAPDGVGGIPNRLNVGGDSTIPPLNNTYRAEDEQFTNPQQITQVLDEGGIVSKKPGIINMPSWKGIVNTAQADALAAYILAGFPHVGVTYDPDPAKAPEIYEAYACIDCHGQVGLNATPPPAPNPKTADKEVPALRNPDDPVPQSEMRTFLMDGSIPDPGAKGVILMPAWGQILSLDQLSTILPYIADGKASKKLPPPPAASPLPLASGSSSSGGTPSPSGSP